MNPAITIAFTTNNTQLPQSEFYKLLALLPPDHHHHILKFKRWNDRQASLFGRLLIRHLLIRTGYPGGCLNNLSFNETGRPTLQLPDLDCSISHSGERVVGCIGQKVRVGIDIERVKPVKVDEMISTLPVLKSFIINNSSPISLHDFFNGWTRFEAVVKGNGGGFGSENRIQVVAADRFSIDTCIWKVHEVSIAADYCCHCAGDAPDTPRVDIEILIVDVASFDP